MDTVLTFEEFAKKYLASLPPGTMLTSNNPAIAARWYIKVTDTITVTPSSYAILLCKRYGDFLGAYNYGAVAMIPAYTGTPTEQPPLLFVIFQVSGQGEFSYRAYKVPLTQIS